MHEAQLNAKMIYEEQVARLIFRDVDAQDVILKVDGS
jgi:hypothetical protein